MSFDDVLAVFSFVFTLAAIIPILKDKRVWLTVVLGALLLITGTLLWRTLGHERVVRRLQSEIVDIVTSRPRSSEDINEDLHSKYGVPEPPTVIDEALQRCIDDGSLSRDVRLYSNGEGDYIKVLVYYKTQ